jgi:hypothetical protein
VLLGLQPRGIKDGEDFDINQAKNALEREVELVVLKNRSGRTGDKLGYKYNTMYNHYREVYYNDSTTTPQVKHKR